MKYVSIIDDSPRCARCHKVGKTDWHHVRCGNMTRKKSEEYGLMIRLCRDCHDYLHTHQEEHRRWQVIAQKKFEEKYDHETWLKTFKKNYLE